VRERDAVEEVTVGETKEMGRNGGVAVNNVG
jgi:hypothetical protein